MPSASIKSAALLILDLLGVLRLEIHFLDILRKMRAKNPCINRVVAELYSFKVGEFLSSALILVGLGARAMCVGRFIWLGVPCSSVIRHKPRSTHELFRLAHPAAGVPTHGHCSTSHHVGPSTTSIFAQGLLFGDSIARLCSATVFVTLCTGCWTSQSTACDPEG